MRRLRFPLLVLFAFGVAYGVTWFAIREKYRVSPTPAHAAVASSETRIEHFRRVLEKETNLLRGTAEMVALIPQLDGKDCQILEEDLIRASSLNAPILHQCAALFACQRANRIAALELSVLETMSAPSIREPFARGIVFARPNPKSAGGASP